jgi:hypothetical protein
MDKEVAMAEADALASKLFTLANEFALAGEGNVAVLLHAACNDVSRANQELKGELSKSKLEAVIRTEMMVNSVLFEVPPPNLQPVGWDGRPKPLYE